jgi:hypothetical protein
MKKKPNPNAPLWDILDEELPAMEAEELVALVREYFALADRLDKMASAIDAGHRNLSSDDWQALYDGFQQAHKLAWRLKKLGYPDADPDYVRQAIEYIVTLKPKEAGVRPPPATDAPVRLPKPRISGLPSHPHNASSIRAFEKQRSRKK